LTFFGIKHSNGQPNFNKNTNNMDGPVFDIVTVDNDSESFGLSASFDVSNVEFFFRRILLTSGGGKLTQVDVVVRVAEPKLVECRLELIAIPKTY
jgi:hypothetical protein